MKLTFPEADDDDILGTQHSRTTPAPATKVAVAAPQVVEPEDTPTVIVNSDNNEAMAGQPSLTPYTPGITPQLIRRTSMVRCRVPLTAPLIRTPGSSSNL